MKLWLISQEHNSDYDTYDSAVVATKTEDEARNTKVGSYDEYGTGTWAAPEYVEVKYIGEAAEGTEEGVILASFNAG